MGDVTYLYDWKVICGVFTILNTSWSSFLVSLSSFALLFINFSRAEVSTRSFHKESHLDNLAAALFLAPLTPYSTQ